ncbi:MAG: hypothetical protein VKO21_05415 [Candidatus Sericytochromatia bacterium]|nr:hypothetical protein [Candidatus Sericytochromatia bacterium]
MYLTRMLLAAAVLGMAYTPAALAKSHTATPATAKGHEAHKASPMEQALGGFHDLLHPVYHDALPKKDLKAISLAVPGLVKQAGAVAACKMDDEACTVACGNLLKAAKALETADKKGGQELLASLETLHGAFEKVAQLVHDEGHGEHHEHHGDDHKGHSDDHKGHADEHKGHADEHKGH